MTTQMSMREKMARAAYDAQRAQTCSDEVWAEIWRWHTNPDVVSKGGTWEVVRMVDAMLDCLTAPPTSDMVTAGCNAMEELRLHISAASKPSRVGLRAGWEAMVRTMIEEGK